MVSFRVAEVPTLSEGQLDLPAFTTASNTRNMQVCVVGLGKMGLPLAAHYATQGFSVVGCDINPQVVASVNRGETLLHEEPGLVERVAEAHRRGLLRATADTSAAVRESDVVIVIVQVALNAELRPEFSAIDKATLAIGQGLRPGTLVIYETTLPVGTTRRFGALLAEQSGLRPGVDFALAFSPERVMSGSVFSDLARYPKIVGGTDPSSTEYAAAFFEAGLSTQVLKLANAEAAEFSKLVETTYRDVNIALANEFARYAARHGIDVLESIAAANTQPYSHVHWPGIGVGGHCIPVYPHFLIENDDTLELPRAARRINNDMAAYGVELLDQTLGGLAGRRILILGLAYRGGVRETLFSSALRLIEVLTAAGAQVLLHDPLYTPAEIASYGAQPVDLADNPGVDAVIMQAYHHQYRDLDYGRFPGLRAVLDGRNVLNAGEVERTGARYLGIGRVFDAE